MSDHVRWVMELDIKEGALQDFNDLMQEMVKATQDREPGTLVYEWFISPDSTRCHISERYADSAAAMAHIEAFGENFADRALALSQPRRMMVYGNPSTEVRQALAPFGALHMAPIGGFAR